MRLFEPLRAGPGRRPLIRTAGTRIRFRRTTARPAAAARQTGGMSIHQNLLGGPAPTHLPDEPGRAAIAAGTPAVEVAAAHPTSSLAWAILADEAFAAGSTVESYAYARTGYHRGLDALRRAGWKGHGPVPWEHEPNRGFLRALHALARAAEAIGEKEEYERCSTFLRDSSPTAADTLSA